MPDGPAVLCVAAHTDNVGIYMSFDDRDDTTRAGTRIIYTTVHTRIQAIRANTANVSTPVMRPSVVWFSSKAVTVVSALQVNLLTGTYFVSDVTWEQSIGFLVCDGWVDDNIVALLPVSRRGDAMLVAKLKSYMRVKYGITA